MSDDLRQAIRDARARDEQLTAAELRDGWQGIDARARRPRSRSWMAITAAATVAAAVAVIVVVRPTPEVYATGPAECATYDAHHVGSFECPTVTAHIDDDTVQLDRQSYVWRDKKNRLEVRAGRVRFDVKARKNERDRLEVKVSDGTIIVVGTAFAVTQRDSGGSVTLEHGTIRFVWRDGETQTLQPGETLVWPRRQAPPPTPEPKPEPTEPEPTDEPKRPQHRDAVEARIETKVESIMQRQFQLRAQHRYDEAMAVLQQAAADKHYTKRQRERFDYELGVLIQTQRGTAAACAHWKHHRETFGNTRDDVRASLEQCK